jgi:hypothetical protein
MYIFKTAYYYRYTEFNLYVPTLVDLSPSHARDKGPVDAGGMHRLS